MPLRDYAGRHMPHGGRQLAIGGGGGAGATNLTVLEGEAPKRVIIQVWDSMGTGGADRQPLFAIVDLLDTTWSQEL